MLTTGIRIRLSASRVGAVTLSLAALAAPAFALEADLNEKRISEPVRKSFTR